MNLTTIVEARARAQPASYALIAPGRAPLTYAAIWQQVKALGDGLMTLGATAGTAVATVLPNGTDAAISFLGIASRATCVPLNPALGADELRFYLQDTGARFVIVDRSLDSPAIGTAEALGITVIEIDSVRDESRDWLATVRKGGIDVRASVAEDIALILHTSGTTSLPKLVPLAHDNLVASARNIARGLRLESADRCLNVMPLFHIHGLVGVLLASLTAGASVVCTRGFQQTNFIDWVAEFQPTWYSAVPTIHQVVASLAGEYRTRLPGHQFRFIRSSSSALSPATMRSLELGTGAPVIEAYGMTEASHQMASNPLPPGARKPGSVGLPSGTEIAIGDGGEIVIRGPGVMAGYGGGAQLNAAAFVDGWFRTGDLGSIDADGYLFLTGRLKEIVNRGGEKISPREVDEALLDHPEVAQAVAFGIPHATLGEDLVAVVVTRAGSSVTARALREFLFSKLTGHKIPSAIVIVDDIPKGATGKVQRSTLYSRLSPSFAPSVGVPGTVLECALEATFRAILSSGPVGLHDNFFSLGGDSLSGARVVARINREQGIELAGTVLFHHPTIAELAAVVEQATAEARGELAGLISEINAMSDEDVKRALADEEGL